MDELDGVLRSYTFDVSIYQDIADPHRLEHIQRVGGSIYQKEDAPSIKDASTIH